MSQRPDEHDAGAGEPGQSPHDQSPHDQALAGIRVLDMSRFIAGPLCAQYLGDMGAEVIKLERPGGEDARRLGPFVNGESLYVMTYNRNKLGITLNTRSPLALPVLEALLAECDVLVENYRPGTLAQTGLGYDRLREINPRLVVTSLSGFGQDGPMAGRALFDAIAQAMSGLMSRTGRPEDPPTLAGTFIADYLTGIYGALGTVTALLRRTMTGEGQLVDVASLDALFSCLGTAPSASLNLGEEPARTGARDPLSGPANLFQTTDGWIYLHAGTDALFRRLCAAMGRPELADQWPAIADRMADIEAVEDVVAGWVGTMATDDAAECLETAGVPVGPVLSVADAVRLPQLQARDMVVPTPHTTAGDVALPGIPVKLSDSPGQVRRGAPTVGEHNGHVYRELLGMSDSAVAQLHAEGVI